MSLQDKVKTYKLKNQIMKLLSYSDFEVTNFIVLKIQPNSFTIRERYQVGWQNNTYLKKVYYKPMSMMRFKDMDDMTCTEWYRLVCNMLNKYQELSEG